MNPKSLHIAQLERLCREHGGHKVVAAAAELNPTYLWQILHATKLASGAPRGVGPKVAAKLEAAYPGWLLAGIKNDVEGAALRPAPQQTEDLLDCLSTLGSAMQRLSPNRRDALAASLSEWAHSGGQDKWRVGVAALLGVLL